MFRQVVALILLLAFVASSFSKAVIVVGFYANRDYIAKNLCENRDKPGTQCCGRCQLHKRLSQDTEQDRNNPERRTENKRETLFAGQSWEALAAPFQAGVLLPYSLYRAQQPVDRAVEIFHPPA